MSSWRRASIAIAVRPTLKGVIEMTEPAGDTRNADVKTTIRGGVGRLTLNRPEAINALTHDMVRTISSTLAQWEEASEVDVVVLDGAGERGLCAGGDIRAIYDDTLGDRSATPLFWADEYRLNLQISELSKPLVAIMDGLVMGGGVGVSAHGAYRIVTERTKLGMPEVGIGLVPDVGGTRLLANAPDNSGMHAALTGDTMGPADAIYAGFADHFVPHESLGELLEQLHTSDPRTAIRKFSQAPGAGRLEATMRSIGPCYESGGVPEIVARLRASGSPEAREALARINHHSPVCLSVAREAVLRARSHVDLRETLDQEYRVSIRCLEAPDLAEGIRAQIIDKDRDPHWQHASVDSVTEDEIGTYFASLGDRELALPKGATAAG